MTSRQNIAVSIVSLLLTVFFFVILFQEGGWVDLRRKRMETAGLQAENKAIMMENLKLFQQVQRLKHDPEYIGHIARTELQMVGKHDLILKYASPMPPAVEEQ
jgi:cell division protein FtsB